MHSGAGLDALDRTDFGAGAAVGTFPGVNHILVVALADGFHRALGLTGSTADTIVANDVCHESLLSNSGLYTFTEKTIS
jgi:hypothetical protein